LIRKETSPRALTLTGVTFSYPRTNALAGIDLTVPAGSYVGIVGPNGSGKTTLAFLIVGILKSSSGSIDTNGMRIGLVLSNPANQIVSLVVEEDIAFGPENMGLPSLEIQSRIGNALADVHGEYLRYSLTSKLSGGQLAKVAYAGQLAMDVDILVLDEGTVMLDPSSRKTLLKTIKEMNTDLGKTVIHISHRLEDLESADEVLVLEDGAITHRSSGVFSLIKECTQAGITGIEAGPHLLYRSFIKEHAIDDGDLEKATSMFADLIKKIWTT
jgi:energy-coupling factor transport system ATP-binding protein